MTTAYVSLGSNIEPAKYLQYGLDRLSVAARMLAVSRVYQTPPFGFVNQPDFLNVTVALETGLDPVALKHLLYDIERGSGRVRERQLTKWGPLELDLDLLLWGDRPLEFGEKPWRVPNDDILKYAAVAAPLAEIAPDVRHPVTGETFAAIAARLGQGGIVVRDDVTVTARPPDGQNE